MQHFVLVTNGDLTLEVGATVNANVKTKTEVLSDGVLDEAQLNRLDPAMYAFRDLKSISLSHRPIPPCTFLVSSRHLAGVSSVWRAMLEPGVWKESSSRRVMMPDDDSKAMYLLLSIIHTTFGNIPKKLARGELYHLAVLCDKYDCVELATPWLDSWLKDQHFDGSYRPGSAFITWTFGLEKALRSVMQALIWQIHATATGSGLSVLNRTYDFDYEIMPSDILGKSNNVATSRCSKTNEF